MKKNEKRITYKSYYKCSEKGKMQFQLSLDKNLVILPVIEDDRYLCSERHSMKYFHHKPLKNPPKKCHGCWKAIDHEKGYLHCPDTRC